MAHNTDVQRGDNTFMSLAQKWEAAFPSQSPVVQALRDTLIHSDFALQHSRTAWQSFHAAVHADACQAEPFHLWPRSLLRHFNFLRRNQAQDTRHFANALKALQTAYTAEQPPKSKAAARTTLAAPPSEPEADLPGLVLQQQMVKVVVENDEVITTVDRDAAFWCRVDLWNVSARFTRHFHFLNGRVPEAYAYVLAHEGVSYPPAPYYSIAYSSEEFARLCQLELDTASPHLLDGQRLFYDRRENSIEELRALYHAQHKEK